LPLEDRIAICVAGLVAEEMFAAPSSHEPAHVNDHCCARELLDEMEEAAQDEVEERGFEGARLKAHAASIEDIDARLLAHRKIDLAGYVLKS
jgi:hypothetical protein